MKRLQRRRAARWTLARRLRDLFSRPFSVGRHAASQPSPRAAADVSPDFSPISARSHASLR